MPWVGLQSVIVTFCGHIHLLFHSVLSGMARNFSGGSSLIDPMGFMNGKKHTS